MSKLRLLMAALGMALFSGSIDPQTRRVEQSTEERRTRLDAAAEKRRRREERLGRWRRNSERHQQQEPAEGTLGDHDEDQTRK